MMLNQLTPPEIGDFETACAFEHVFGSKALTALRAYGLADTAIRFFLCRDFAGKPGAALYLANDVLTISACESCDLAPIALLAADEKINEIDTDLLHCEALQKLLGGRIESSYYMQYNGGPITGEFPGIQPGKLPEVFEVLQRSHEYYRTHLRYDRWSADLSRKLEAGLMELWQFTVEGKTVGTGSIISEDAECGVLAAVAVIPEYRHRGLGAQISRFLTSRVLQKGKTPRLISGYDEVAALYRGIGYTECGRWGELYMKTS